MAGDVRASGMDPRRIMVMKNVLQYLFFIAFIPFVGAQDTFSIVAVDSTTGEIGSAGASCLDDRSFPGSGGAYIISDIIPGVGAVHTQSFWLMQNQVNAHERMKEGLTAAEIADWLTSNDAQRNPEARQYGMVTMDTEGMVDAYAFTGSQCFDKKAHRMGLGYAIQGNILISEAILDSMEARFLRTDGPLCEKLMAALQGANVPGADSRCLDEGVSSQSAFIRVARRDDDENDIWMDLNVPETPFGAEPIDALQDLFDEFKQTSSLSGVKAPKIKVSPNPVNDRLKVSISGGEDVISHLQLWNLQGEMVRTLSMEQAEMEWDMADLAPGFYLLRWVTEENTYSFYSEKIVIQ